MNSFPVSYFSPMKGGWVIDCAVGVTGVSMTQAASEPWGNFTPNSSARREGVMAAFMISVRSQRAPRPLKQHRPDWAPRALDAFQGVRGETDIYHALIRRGAADVCRTRGPDESWTPALIWRNLPPATTEVRRVRIKPGERRAGITHGFKVAARQV